MTFTYKNIQFIDLISEQILLVNCYILNSNFDTEYFEHVCSKLIKEESNREQYGSITLILHSINPSCKLPSNMLSDYLGEDYYNEEYSVMLITKDAIVGHNII